MADRRDELQRYVHEAARQAGLALQPHHVPGVTENFARLAAQAELLSGFELDEADEPAAVYTP